MAAASSRTMLKSSSAALNLFTKLKQPILNQITLRASALPSTESCSSRFNDQLAEKPHQQLRELIGRSGSGVEGMRMARGYRKVVDSVEEDEEDEDDDGFDDVEDFDGLDSDEEVDDVEFEDEDDQLKKVRTRSHRDF